MEYCNNFHVDANTTAQSELYLWLFYQRLEVVTFCLVIIRHQPLLFLACCAGCQTCQRCQPHRARPAGRKPTRYQSTRADKPCHALQRACHRCPLFTGTRQTGPAGRAAPHFPHAAPPAAATAQWDVAVRRTLLPR